MSVNPLDQYLPVVNGEVILSVETFPNDTFPLEPFGDLLRDYNAGHNIVIRDATKTVTEDVVTVQGIASLGGMSPLPVTGVFTLDGRGVPMTALRFTLIDGEPTVTSWRFSLSFDALPVFPQGKGGTDFLDRLVLSDAAFVLTTWDRGTDSVTSAPLVFGWNFAGKLRPQGVIGLLGAVGVDQTVPFYGKITPPLATDETPPLPPRKSAWEVSWKLPGILLEADLGLDSHIDSSNLRLSETRLRIYTPLTQAWFDRNGTYAPDLAVTGTLSAPSASLPPGESLQMAFKARVFQEARILSLTALLEGFSLSNLAALTEVAAGDLFEDLPEELKQHGQALGGDLTLEAVGITFVGSLLPSSIYVTVGMRNLELELFEEFRLTRLFADFAVSSPFAEGRSVSLTLGGEIDFAGTRFLASVQVPEMIGRASLLEQTALPLSRLLERLGLTSEVPDLSVDAIELTVARGQGVSFNAILANTPPWELDLGPAPVQVSDLMIAASRTRGRSNAAFAGSVRFGDDLTLALHYAVPGEFLLRATFDDIRLRQLIQDLLGEEIAAPSGFDLRFATSWVVIRRSSAQLILQAATEIDQIGTFVLQLQRASGGQRRWGFALGLSLNVGGISDLAGLEALALFEELFELKRLVLVLSSFDEPSLQFPDLAVFAAPVLTGKEVKLPSHAGGLVTGLNLYADWVIHTGDAQQNLLKELLGLDPRVGVTLQIGTNPATNARLYVSYSTSLLGRPLTCLFGGQIENGRVGLFLQGSMQVEIQGEERTVTVELLFVAGGAFISGTVQEDPIDFHVFKLANLALEIGVNWGGIPSLGVAGTLYAVGFQSSIAVFFDSTNPTRSMVAGSVSDLSLKDVLDALAGDVVPSEIEDVLDQVALLGTNEFELPGSVADDLDNLMLDNIAAAFAAAGQGPLPTSIREVLLVVDRRGERWFLTNLRAGARHYQLQRSGDKVRVSEQAQLYFAPQRTAIGALIFDQGFFLSGAIRVLDFKARARIDVNMNRGIAVDAQMDKIVIVDERLFSVSSADGQGGPRLSAATFGSPHFYLSGQMKLLGLTRSVYIRLTRDGFEVELKGGLPGVHFDVRCRIGGPRPLDARGALRIGLDPIDLGLLGRIVLPVGVSGAMTLEVRGDNDVTATLTASFLFAGQSLSFDLGLREASLEDLPSLALAAARGALGDLLRDPLTWVRYVLEGFIQAVDDLLGVLTTAFSLSAEQALAILAEAENIVDQACATRTAARYL